MHTELYERLGIRPAATEAEIKKAFRALAARLHPDKNPNNPAAETRFKKITAAYDVLSDKDRRANYDEFGPDSLASGFDAARARTIRAGGGRRGGGFGAGFGGQPLDFDINDFLGGWGRGGGRGAPRQPPAREASLDVDLGEALRGIEVEVGGQRVRIPPGAEDGASVKVTTPQGPLRIRIHVREHAHFRRDGLDLTLRLPVTLAELALGGSVDVPTPDGPVAMKIPPRTAPGARLRLRGKGVVRKEQRGDLYVELIAQLPTRWDDAFVAACEKVEGLYDKPVRAGVEL
ncbi:MAG: J domain-containing protein [Myxococcales bacterium]|nr:J domain-containing protein [Myxococcales bacterium]